MARKRQNGLTDAQERFCQAYLKHLNLTLAYQEAYPKASPSSARSAAPRLFANVRVQDRIAELQAERDTRVQVETDDILRSILEIRDRCMQGEPILDGEGKPTGEWRFDARHALRANELLGKHKAMWVERMRHEDPNGRPLGTSALSDEERIKRARELVTRARNRKKAA